jgi:hypothetical protein
MFRPVRPLARSVAAIAAGVRCSAGTATRSSSRISRQPSRCGCQSAPPSSGFRCLLAHGFVTRSLRTQGHRAGCVRLSTRRMRRDAGITALFIAPMHTCNHVRCGCGLARPALVRMRSRQTGARAAGSARRCYSGLIATLRNLITPAPCCSVNGPSTNRPLCSSTVFWPLSFTVTRRPLAVISKVFHLPPAFGIG